jgi:hypothetical protein
MGILEHQRRGAISQNAVPESPIRAVIGSINTSPFLRTNPTGEPITSRLPVTRQEPRLLGFCRTTPTLDSCSNTGESPSQPARRERSLGLQTYAPKKVLESRIRAQAVKRKVGL